MEWVSPLDSVADGAKAIVGLRHRFRPTYPDFLPRGATNIRVCGFH
jgi:hypothetical protein